jgi:predicted ATPase
MSLARRWSTHGRQAHARQMLWQAYEGFTEGFDTEDLREAAALLAALA